MTAAVNEGNRNRGRPEEVAGSLGLGRMAVDRASNRCTRIVEGTGI